MALVLSIDGGKKVLEPNRVKFPEVDEAWLVAEKDKDILNDGLSHELIDDSELPTSAQQAESDTNDALSNKRELIVQKLRTATETESAWAELSPAEQSEAARLSVIMTIPVLDSDSEG